MFPSAFGFLNSTVQFRRFLCGLGTRGKVGVTGMALGGVFAGRRAACLASASLTNELLGRTVSVLSLDCLKSLALIEVIVRPAVEFTISKSARWQRTGLPIDSDQEVFDMLVMRLQVPEGARLFFQPSAGPLSHADAFHDLGQVIRAEQHADASDEEPEILEDYRLVLDCRGVAASQLTAEIDWPLGAPELPGVVRYGDHAYPATLQLRARAKGLRAILRKTP